MPKVSKKLSKQQYLARRRARVRDLYLCERLTPRQISERLVREGTIETSDTSLDSALRLVRFDVAEIRAELVSYRAGDADPSLAFDETDALEAELTGLRKERDRQLVIADGEPIEMCARSQYSISGCANPACMAEGKHVPFVGPAIGVTMTDTPQGMMTSYKALWPAGVRQKASKDAALLTERISKLEVVLAEKRKTASSKPTGVAADRKDDEEIFRIVTSSTPTDELIARNATSEKVN